MRSGVTLVELLVGLAIVAILAAVAVPPLARTLDSFAVHDAETRIVLALDKARVLAVAQNRLAFCQIRPDSVLVATIAGSDTLIAWADAGPAASGVALDAPAQAPVFSPIGWSIGWSNGTYELSRGQAHRTVVLSRLGRVTVTN